MDVRVPLQVSSKCMQDRNEARSKQFRFIIFVEHSEDNRANSAEKAVQEVTVFKEKMSEGVVDCKDAVTVLGIDDLRRHGKGAVNRILIATGRAETAMTAKGDKLELSAFGTAVHSTTVGRIATVDYLIHVFNDRIAWVKDI